MELSVVILNYNVKFFLELCLKSVEQAIKNINAEIIVVDNDSSDGSCDMVKHKFPSFTLISNQDNVGFAKANNQGVKAAKGCGALSADVFFVVLDKEAIEDFKAWTAPLFSHVIIDTQTAQGIINHD